MKLEVGGGNRPKEDNEGWYNMDQLECADIVWDLDISPWPIEDDIVEELYSSHCIEHVKCPFQFLREICRICKVGAKVEIRCPDAQSEMAMVSGHNYVFPINVVRHLDHIFPELFWNGEKRLRLDRIEPGADDYWFPMARESRLFKDYSDDEILTWVPRTRHENRFHLYVDHNDVRPN